LRGFPFGQPPFFEFFRSAFSFLEDFEEPPFDPILEKYSLISFGT